MNCGACVNILRVDLLSRMKAPLYLAVHSVEGIRKIRKRATVCVSWNRNGLPGLNLFYVVHTIAKLLLVSLSRHS
jgi:hypothetical protein